MDEIDVNSDESKSHDIDKLNNLYVTSERVDNDLFAEMRSNILLVAGQHYTKRTSKFFARLRNTNRLSEVQKLRITKNHIHKITRHYRNSILSKVPGVAIKPQNDLEMQDRKSAELNQAIWDDAKDRYNLRQEKRGWCADFVEIGEVAVKMFFDPTAGYLKGYEQDIDDIGEPKVDMEGQPIPDKTRPVFSGAIKFEKIPCYDLLRSPFAKNMADSEYLIYRKMVDKKVLKENYAGDPDKLKMITESEKETYVVFESQKAHYAANKTEILVMEYYFKPSVLYPEGYYYITTDAGILDEGPFPYGLNPIIWEGFDVFFWDS